MNRNDHETTKAHAGPPSLVVAESIAKFDYMAVR